MPLKAAPPPDQIVVDPSRPTAFLTSTRVFRLWLLAFSQRSQASPLGLTTETIGTGAAGVTGAVLTTSALTTTTAGLYRVSYYARIVTPASSSSSLVVILGWQETAVSLTVSGSAMTGNLTSTVQTGSIVVPADANTDLTYATTFVSVGATAMRYRLTVFVELVA